MRSFLAVITILLCSTAAFGSSPELVFSEYVEGSSFNKAVEIYNGTDAPVDLAAGGYRIELYSNGSPTISQQMSLAGTIAPGDVFVVAHASASGAIQAAADVLNSSVINFNGDDAVVLRKGDAAIDVIGQIGFDPGSQWGSGLTSTADNTIRRKADACLGDTDPTDPFDPSVQWDGFAQDTFDGLGSHDSPCGPPPPPPTPDLTIDDVAVSEGDSGSVVATFTISLSAPAGAAGVQFDAATRDGSAGPDDYASASIAGAVIPAGQSSTTFNVTVFGDTLEESAENFFVDVTNVSGATVSKGTGEGTIVDDDVTPAGTATELFFSEYIEGSSFNKAVEIFNGSAVTVDLAPYRVELYANGATSPTAGVNLGGTLATGDVFVVAHGSAALAIQSVADLISSAVANFNGDDAVVLLKDGEVIDAFGQTGFDPGSAWGTPPTSTINNTLRRGSDVCAGDAIATDPFDPALEWEGFGNDEFSGLGSHFANCIPGFPPPPPPPATAEIFEIQGSGVVSPLSGQIVTTFGNVVTAVGPAGFFIQTPTHRADASEQTSNGIYVFTNSAPGVQVGNEVEVTGRVVEFFNMTEFTGPELVWTVTAPSVAVPEHVTLAPGFSDFEQLEGMLVRVQGGVAASGTDQFGSTAMVAASTRPFRADAPTHPEIFEVDPTDLGGDGAHQNVVGGASIELAEGPMTFSFNDYVVWTTALEFANPPFPRPVRAAAAGELTVGAQNMLRLFDDRDDPSIDEPVTDSAVYAARLAAISDHIRNNLVSPDVLAVSEVENQITLADLAARLNGDAAWLGYTAYLEEGNDIGGIDVGFLVRDTVLVESIEQLGADDTWVEPSGATSLLNDRPPLLLRGSYAGNGAPFEFAAIAVHQRSMIDVETSARVRAKRLEQAHRLAGYVNDLRAGDPDLRVVVTGDFNAFEFDDGFGDVMGTLTSEAALTNQVLSLPADERYSYIHEGAAQVLDHSLTSAPLAPFVRGLEFARANADAPVLLGRTSDHDGLVLFVMTDHDGDGIPDDLDQCATGDASPTVVLGDCDSGAPNLAFEGGCTLTDRLLALRPGARNHGAFVSEAGKLLNQLRSEGLLTGEEKDAIQSCVGQYR